MPYTYLIGWTKHNRYYYGARWAKDCSTKDLWHTYFTSSKYVKTFRKKYGEPDVIQIRKTFSDIDKCRFYEQKTLKKLNVLTEDKWLNRSINGLYLPYGPQCKDHVNKRVKAGIETRKKNGNYRTAMWNKHSHPDTSKKIAAAHLGVPKSAGHVASMRKRIQDTTSVSCLYCHKSGDYKNMKRWHMDRCKHNPNRLADKDPKSIICTHCGFEAKQSPNFYRNHNKYCKSNPKVK